MRIAVDAMGGDHAPAAPVGGAVLAARDGVPVTLVGEPQAIQTELTRLGARDLSIEIAPAATVVAMDDLAPAATVRADPDSSISVGMVLVRQGEADALVTVGHTGAGMAAALLRLGRIPGVRRPALAAPFPTKKGPCLILDVGANTDVKAEDLAQFAVMGSAYAQGVFGLPRPRVGLVSIGEEDRKGSQVVQEAWNILSGLDLNFVGNLEGRDIPEGTADVAVVDGFTGNVLIKFAEGLVGLVEMILSDAAARDPLGAIGGLLLRPSLRRARSRMDYRSYGGAVLLGVRRIVVIGHGRSDPEAVRTAIQVARRGVESGVVDTIAAGIRPISEAT